MIKEINVLKNKLIKRAEKTGLYENFGKQEVMQLKDKYFRDKYSNNGVWQEIEEFENWCMNYNLRG